MTTPRTATCFPIKLKSRTVFLAPITGILTAIADCPPAAARMMAVDMDFLMYQDDIEVHAEAVEHVFACSARQVLPS
jgi:hypothetical protein